MTTQAPDPRDFKSWKDAFAYPVPVVRRLEQQLQGSVNENRDKLRTLVGASYRDLLSTAERIIDMDKQMHETEDLLGEIGQKCNARAIERIAINHSRNVKSQRERGSRRNALASTLALLQNCLTIGGRIIKRRGSPLVAAKLLVLARLLHVSASKSSDAPPLLDTLRTRLVSLRRRVLASVDKTFARIDTEKDILLETLAAFSLATTSTPTDVLNHFLKTRARVMSDLLEEPSESNTHAAMTAFLSTLRVAQSLFPRRLSLLLMRLQDEPLLRSNGIRATMELDLDIHERWIAEDVRNFTPYLRHDQLHEPQAIKILQTWAKVAKTTLLTGLKSVVASMSEAPKVMTLRRDIILRCLTADRKLPGLDQAGFFDALRACFMGGLERIATETSNELITIVKSALNDEQANGTVVTSNNLWDALTTDVELGQGAVDFRALIINASQGKDARLHSLDRSMRQWSSHMSDLATTIKGMKEDRWQDDLDLDLDDDLEFESAPQDSLTKEEPNALRVLMEEQQKKAISAVYEQLESTVTEKTDARIDAIFLLRLLRELIAYCCSTGSSATLVSPPSSLVDTLHAQLSYSVVERCMAHQKATSLTSLQRRPATTLWEGNPPLPAQPSPACVRFLHETCKSMKDVGADLWTDKAVEVLKHVLRDLVAESAIKVLTQRDNSGKEAKVEHISNGTGHVTAETNGYDAEEGVEGALNGESGTAQKQEHEKLVQLLWDMSYLDRVLGLSRNNGDEKMETSLLQVKVASGVEEAAMERMRKSSVDYYKRTYLLFGLLAAH